MLMLEPCRTDELTKPVRPRKGGASSVRWSMDRDTKSGLLRVICYLLAMLGLNLAWEIAQLPLYTIWTNAPIDAKVWAVAHCTMGDALVASAALLIAWLVAGRPRLQAGMPLNVAAVAIGLGIAFTIFSEWRATRVVHSWEYSAWMPVIPWLQVGLTPVLQWLAIPPIAMEVAFGLGKRLSPRRI